MFNNLFAFITGGAYKDNKSYISEILLISFLLEAALLRPMLVFVCSPLLVIWNTMVIKGFWQFTKTQTKSFTAFLCYLYLCIFLCYTAFMLIAAIVCLGVIF